MRCPPTIQVKQSCNITPCCRPLAFASLLMHKATALAEQERHTAVSVADLEQQYCKETSRVGCLIDDHQIIELSL